MNQEMLMVIEDMRERYIPMYVKAMKEVIDSDYDIKKEKVVDTTIPNKIIKEAKAYTKQWFLEKGETISYWDIYYPVYNECVKEANKLPRKFEKEYQEVENNYLAAREILESRQKEINELKEELKTTKNQIRAKFIMLELERLESEYNQIDSLI